MNKKLYLQMRILEDQHWWFLGRRHIVKSVIDKLNINKEAMILDVGCGTGGNLSMLADYGTVIGSETNADAAQIAKERNIAQIVRSSLPNQMPFPEKQFHLITLLDVLEHIEEDQASLVRLNGLLRSGGYLVLTVPAFQFLWSAHDIEHHHWRRYLASQLEQRLEQSGLKVQWLSYYNSLLFPFIASIRIFGRFFLSRSADSVESKDLFLPPPNVNRWLEKLFSIESKWLGRCYIPFGVSIIAIARKP